MSRIITLHREFIGNTKNKLFLNLNINPVYSEYRLGNLYSLYAGEFTPGHVDAEYLEDRQDRYDVWHTGYFAIGQLALAMQAFDVRMSLGGFFTTDMGSDLETILGSDSVPHFYELHSHDTQDVVKMYVNNRAGGFEAKMLASKHAEANGNWFKIVEA
jgi:hypothetical protein